MDSNKTENLSISSTKDSIIKSELATKTKPQKQFWGFFVFNIYYSILITFNSSIFHCLQKLAFN